MGFELCHPGGRVRAGVAGARVAGSDPSAGAVVSCQPPRGGRWRCLEDHLGLTNLLTEGRAA